ncbi:MAG: TrkH family potassium uptake protein [Bacteroidales bacterium]|nr:TrkH family potassium uptake protein [Bacteroidales bacterium]
MGKIANLYFVFRVISRILLIETVALLFCAALSDYYAEDPVPFLISAFISFFVGVCSLLFRGKSSAAPLIHRRDAYITVTLSWLIISWVGALPYLFSGAIPGITNAFFESVSGFTTTGSSILADIESLPAGILFWRSLTHWIGGIGIIVLVILLMPELKIGGYHLFTLESSLQGKIQPKIRSVGNRLFLIYLLLTVGEIVLLLAGGMNLFESTCHAFGTVATGGFSPKNTSIASYSPYIQYVIMLFMLLSGTNFVIHYYLLKREFRKVHDNDEFRFYLVIVFIVGILITSSLVFVMGKPIEVAFREGFFQVISIITCTGYATADYMQWPVFAWGLLFFAMFFGGSTGSTAGGIKMARHLVLLRNLNRAFKQLLSTHAIVSVKLNNKVVSDDSNRSILSFISVYLLLFVAGSILMAALGVDLKTSASSVATCMAGIGPGIGSVGPAANFAHLPESGKLLLSFLMITGRLEIYTILALFSIKFWKK